MKKIINPCKCKAYFRNGKTTMAPAFCTIEFNEKGNLSIRGVIGPLQSGNCLGSAGQCVDEIRQGEPENGWTKEMLNEFCDIWEQWHLNDMRPYCEHQRELGWDKDSKEKVKIYHYTLNMNTIKERLEIEEDARNAIKEFQPFIPTKRQTFVMNLEYHIERCGELTSGMEEFYELGYYGRSAIEEKRRGWIRFEENNLGILGKPCPVCGYKYGTKWIREEVPADIIGWLIDLPSATKKCAWNNL